MNPISKYLHLGAIVALLGAAAFMFMQYAWLKDEQTAHEKTKTLMAKQLSDANERTAKESEKNRKIEQEYQRNLKEREDEFKKRLASVERVADALRRDNARLRDEAATAAAGNRSAADDTVEACRLRAAGLAELFSEASSFAAEVVAATERTSAAVTFVCNAWPEQVQ